jgi:PTH1 family peptidyl-tRNA hydrolase
MWNLIVGLGNPGERYKNTRHNLGYRVVDSLAEQNKKDFKPGRGKFLFCKIRINDARIFLMKPLTFMNSSGVAVVEVLDDLNLGVENLLVVCDDASLPLGKIRIREKGTDGGHKGLRSIIYQLNTIEFARLRMGIGDTKESVDLEEFVLQDFEEEEKEKVSKMVGKAAEAVENIFISGIEDSMNRFNI